MRLGESAQLTLRSGMIAAATVCPFLVLAALEQRRLAGWVALGWLLATLPALAAAGPLVRAYGVPGSRFFKLLGACMAVRMIAFPAGVLLVARSGEREILAYAVGLFAGYVPTQACEALWFLERSRRRTASWSSALASGMGRVLHRSTPR